MKNDLGIIGLATMGANLAQNLADHGFKAAVFNRTSGRTKDLMEAYGQNRGLSPFYDLREFIDSLKNPKIVLLMVQAGQAVDEVLNELISILEKNDIVIDGGNSFFKDTMRRQASLEKNGVRFAGMGISGGEEGARRGASIMPGASKDVWKIIKPIFSKAAAKDFGGRPCVSLIGANGAGHFVKMVHNAIEYIDMQLIAETYWMMKEGLGMNNKLMAETFSQWNRDRLNSYLIEITAKILTRRDANGKYIIDKILDCAGNKGTGKWTSIEALDLGVPAFSVSAAVFARYISAFKKERLVMAKKYKKRAPKLTVGVEQLEKTLYASKILAYAQGYELIQLADKQYGWKIDMKEISRVWEGGCIIRAGFLNNLYKIYKKEPGLKNILLSHFFGSQLLKNIDAARKTAAQALSQGIPIPAILSSISYFDSVSSASLPANLLQAQRDFFGAHTFQTKIDGEFEHCQWEI